MRVLKVVAEGLTTSFRRPHFMHGIQPTFRMPPPATIYGHVCSALGDVVPPEGIAFAYHFTAQISFSDIEHMHIVYESSGKLQGASYPKVLEGAVNPFKRELLFQPRLTLYLNRPEWIDAFRSPRYVVVLGRSQDLFVYTSIQTIELQQAEKAYFEYTLLPYDMAVKVGSGITELLPRYLDYERKRTPTFARYLLLEHRVYSNEFWDIESSTPKPFWIDPTSPPRDGTHLGLFFHTFVGEIMKPSLWPDWLDNTWAKSKQEGKSAGESLAQHTWNVLERLAELARLRPQLASQLDAPNIWHCLFWTCFLHDFGKAANGFQKMLRDGQRWRQRHEVLSLAFLDWLTPSLSKTEQKWVLAAIVSHHRDAYEIAAKYDGRMEPDPLIGLLADLDEEAVRHLWRWLQECSDTWIEALGLHSFGIHTLSIVGREKAVQITCSEGIQRTRSWLDTYDFLISRLPSERDQRVVSSLVTLRGLTTTADHMASAHLPHVPQGIQRSWEHFASDDLKIKTHYHQRASAAHHHTSAMLIAPTGSGKTEAALFWAIGDGLAPTPRIFYALPYQASMNAMYDRLRSPHYFGDASVGLQHGRALQALYQRLMRSESGPKSARQDAKWRENLTRLHACPIKVFSPYQMLKVVYRIKGFEGMLTDYTQAAFIFDEIHAYEPGRLAIILCLIKYLREHFGARFFIMSATFPDILRNILSEVIGITEPVVAESELFEQFKRHHLQLLDGDLLEKGVDRIVADVQQGKSVLVCCNTVRRAQEIQASLLNELPAEQVELIHSRFTLGDRLKREEAISTRCNVDAEHTALAVVATQVIEVSLNIDLDTIYSDPAPLEALVQRFGRVNRARKKGIVPVHVFREPLDGQHVYEKILVQKTIDVLNAHQDEDIDEAAISQWLNEIYNRPEIYTPWMKKYNDQYQLVDRLLRSLRPFNSDEKSEEEFEKLFDGVEVLPKCFEHEYVDLIARDEFIEASRLFVSISQKKYQQLANQGKIRMLGDDKRKSGLVMLPYSSEHGLIFDSSLGDWPDGD